MFSLQVESSPEVNSRQTVVASTVIAAGASSDQYHAVNDPHSIPEPELARHQDFEDATYLQHQHASLRRLAVCIAILFASYFFSRGWCYAGIPTDCQRNWTPARHRDLCDLFLRGCVLVLMTGLNQTERCTYFLKPFNGLTLLFTLLMVSPVYSWISGLKWPTFNNTEHASSGDTYSYGAISGLCIIILSVILWHINYCRRHARSELLNYIAMRAGLGVAYGIYALYHYVMGNQLHIHHFWIAWLLVGVPSSIRMLTLYASFVDLFGLH